MEQTKVKFEFTPHSAYGQQLDIFAEYVRQKYENATVGLLLSTANGYTCLEKLTTEKCKQQAKQPEKKILKIKISWKFSLQYLSYNTWKKYYFIEMNVCLKDCFLFDKNHDSSEKNCSEGSASRCVNGWCGL